MHNKVIFVGATVVGYPEISCKIIYFRVQVIAQMVLIVHINEEYGGMSAKRGIDAMLSSRATMDSP